MRIGLEDLDYELVRRIAKAELCRFEGRPWNAFDDERMSAPVAACYLESYLDERSLIANPIMLNAFEDFEAIEDAPMFIQGTDRPWSAEFVAGHALAVAARNHACADLDLVLDAFSERALCEGDVGPLDRAGDVAPSREEGVDLDRPIRSAQTITARDIATRAQDYAFDKDGEELSALDHLTSKDFEDIAESLMASFGGIELDYPDLEDVDCRIGKLLEDKGVMD